jgi:hypothetical protein
MRQTLIAIVARRAACLALFVLVCFCGAATAGEMTSSLVIGNSRIDINIEGSTPHLTDAEIIHWVQSAAESVSAYYGRFPVPHASIRIIPTDGRGVRNGRTFGDESGGRISIRVGNDTIAAGLAMDWMLTHEMVHLSFPSVAEEHHWIEEGIATYVEPLARIRAGHMKMEQIWFELVRDMPQGLPKAGDEGLDHTHTWGRTYWGGALFCLVADVEIRKQTKNAKGLEDALRGILDAGGDIRKDWKLEDALKAGDRATGVSVLLPQYEKMKDAPVNVDLDALWSQLGVHSDGTKVTFDDSAPLAATRRAITGEKSSAAAQRFPLTSPQAVFAGRSVDSRE